MSPHWPPMARRAYGPPQFYVHDGWNLYFLSAPTSRHCVNLANSAQVAITIQADYADWPGIKGVQMDGVVDEIHGDALARARDLYGQKFPVVGKLRWHLLRSSRRWRRCAGIG